MPSHSTPGVYIEEVPGLPPSIAPVATAIPVFIGYTQTARDRQGQDLTRKSVRINSVLEYEACFGTSPVQDMKLKLIQHVGAGPPSAAIAGVYAQVDRSRGVWKAPANLALSRVSGPAVNITRELQDEFGPDNPSGLSVNVIRTLSGKGALMGARPEQAFGVAIGLGKTMSAEDVLDGRMIVVVRLALFRPAEFMVLSFMQKMAET